MISWTEKRPDFFRRPLDDLTGEMTFTKACAIILAGRMPRVVVAPCIMAGIFAHLREERMEMGGLLLGAVYEGLSGPDDFIIEIVDFVRSIEFLGTSVSLRMDSDVWERARRSAGGSTVVGWYHSHPDLGVFFSGTDRRTQRAFFNQPHSIGLVVDPIRLEEKWFIGPDSVELQETQILW
ncbi:Mov34/MPN/PAD-1 family protein [Bradyrhizobium oligotrophicum S58]